MLVKSYLKQLPQAIIQWYNIGKESRTACLVSDHGISKLIAEALEERKVCVDPITLDELENSGSYKGENERKKETYDIVFAIDVIEYAQDVDRILRNVKSLLKPDGRLLLAADNRLGIRYFCGDQDFFTGKNYDGIENYRHLCPWEREDMKGRAYSKAELTRFLEGAGFDRHRFFSVFPRISNPQILLAEDYEPNEAIDIRVFPEYNNPNTVFLCEEELYPALMENKLLHPMANGFFIECPLDSKHVPVNQVTLSGERGKENAMATIIRSDGVVEKCVLYPSGRHKLEQLMENYEYLSAHGVRMIDMKKKGDSLIMPYVSGVPATDYFRDLLKQDPAAFLSQLDVFWDTVLHSGELSSFDDIDWENFEPGCEEEPRDEQDRNRWKKIALGAPGDREELGAILKRGYLDLVSLNCFYLNNEFVFYDQELYLENVPAKAILLRTIEFIYKFQDHLDTILPRDMLLERYGLKKYRALYNKFVSRFLDELRQDHGLSDYFQETRREYRTVLKNRERMNYSEEEYNMIFKDVFCHIKGRKLYLFGSGKYAQRFREKYEAIYPVAGYLDNNKSRWGMEVNGSLVFNPAVLREMKSEEYKVIICIRNYLPVVKQLRRAGIANFSVYNPDVE